MSLVYREHSQIIFFVRWLSSFLAGDAVAAHGSEQQGLV